MTHGIDHHHADLSRSFAVGVGLNAAYVIVEAAYGLYSGSLALLADAGHNLSDIAGLLVAWGGVVLAVRKPTITRTYGFRRVTILAALAGAFLLLIAIGGIIWESILRFSTPTPVDGVSVVVVASIGVVINTITAWMFMAGRKHDLNIRSAYLHMAADAGVSFGVVLAGIGIWITGWLWLDPAIGIVIAIVILAGTWTLLRESLGLAIDAVPPHIDAVLVHDYLNSLAGVTDVHDLHIWSIGTTDVALTAHLVVDQYPEDSALLVEAAHHLDVHFGIHHTTMQIEDSDISAHCRQAVPGSL